MIDEVKKNRNMKILEGRTDVVRMMGDTCSTIDCTPVCAYIFLIFIMHMDIYISLFK
jgi:hypothetical protein